MYIFSLPCFGGSGRKGTSRLPACINKELSFEGGEGIFFFKKFGERKVEQERAGLPKVRKLGVER